MGKSLSSWTTRTVQDLCSTITSGGTPLRSRPDYYHPGTIPWVKTGELRDSSIFDTEEHISDLGLAESAAKILPRGTVLMAMYGATVGQLGLLREPASCNQAACAMIADPDVCDSRWLFYRLLDDRERIVSLATGAAQQNLSARAIREFAYPCPPVDEQRAIAEVLGALDDKIVANTSCAATVDHLLATFLDELLTSGESVPAPLGTIADVNAAAARPTGGELRYIDIASVGVGRYEYPPRTSWSAAPGRARRRVRAGDTLWSTVRPNRRSHALNLSDDPLLVGSTGLAVITPRTIGFAYLYQITKLPEFAMHLESQAEGSAYPAVRAEVFEAAPVPLLPEKARMRFESVAAPLRTYVHSLDTENRALADLRDNLLPHLMSGRLRVRDAEKQVEAGQGP
jgi:type I restriction enzyme S subunit